MENAATAPKQLRVLWSLSHAAPHSNSSFKMAEALAAEIHGQVRSFFGPGKDGSQWPGDGNAKAKVLMTYAHQVAAQMIVIENKADFTDFVLSHCDLPLLVLPPEHETISSFHSIFFPTDFSDASRRALEKILTLFPEASFFLFHFIPHSLEPILQTGINILGGGWVSLHDYLHEDNQIQNLELEKWADLARGKGHRVRVLASSSALNTAAGILSQAQITGSDLIAMAAHSGTVSSALLGSVSRQVVKESLIPVLMVRG